MGGIKKKKAAKAKKPVKYPEPVDGALLPDMGNDPVFIKKAEQAKAMLKSMGEVFDKEY